jgi:Fe-S-cluster containining protein
MSESCIINGQRCTSCCRAIAMSSNLSFFRSITLGDDDAGFIGKNWKPLKRRQAKKQNRYAFDEAIRLSETSERHWFRCSKVTEHGCSVHADRPDVCRSYPLYGRPPESVSDRKPEYHPECTEWPLIPVVDIPTTYPCRSCGQETTIEDPEKFDPGFHYCNRSYRCVP